MVCILEKESEKPVFPKYYKDPKGFLSDALYIRHDSWLETVIVTKDGTERPPTFPWEFWMTILMVKEGELVEMTKQEAAKLLT